MEQNTIRNIETIFNDPNNNNKMIKHDLNEDPYGFESYLSNTARMPEEEIALVTVGLRRERFEKGSILLRNGDVCQNSFFVERGLLRAYMLDDSGKEHLIQFAPENWFIVDRSSVYFNDPSDSFIEAIEDTEVVYLDEGFMARATEVSITFAKFNEKLLHNHIRQMQKRIHLLLGATAERRYLDFIKMYPDLLLRAPQWMIASYLGITPESLSRVRKELALKNFRPG
ncbi:MAG TPA: Crp/Fnr family transcriptional regulator [Aequorivita sp.]|nr:Crp/Fnr family transcriptional regulator [Aequorivita sp.]